MTYTIATLESVASRCEQPHLFDDGLIRIAATLVTQFTGLRLCTGRSCLVLAGSNAARRETLLALQLARLQGAHPLLFAGVGGASVARNAERLGADAAVSLEPGSNVDSILRDLCQPAVEHVICIGIPPVWLQAAMSVTADDGEVAVLGLGIDRECRLNFYPDLHKRQVSLRGIDGRRKPSERQRSAAKWLLQTGRLREED